MVFTRSPAALAAIEFSRGFKPTALQDLFPVASATIEFSRRSRDVGIFADRPVGLNPRLNSWRR